MRDFSAVELGASLYVPATHKDILAIANGEKFPHLKSVIFCLEDAINCDDLEVSMKNITNMLNNFEQNELKLFIRPRDIENLTQLLKAPNIKKIDGFALAKFSTCNMHEYLSVLETTCSAFHLMPVLESLDMFDINALKNIREFLLKKRIHNILTIRVGAEDMFKMIGIKKDCNTSIHDLHVSSGVLADILATFKPYGFNVSSTVYNCLKNLEFFTQEVRRDVKEG
ncbi:MAG: HpcH/HpaI aldolase/citrate lyase family protein, partial [Campylobacterota bacterium]|nr:HpcH/HpaI aldolase/citrate lyase family protein [Campylobacterota bacterium]